MSGNGRPPLVVAWEVTRACPLACRHCRATAQHEPHPAELSHEEGLAFIDDLARTYPGAVLILTGGEPLTRTDTLALAEAGSRRGLQVALSVDAGWLLTPEMCSAIRDAGITAVSFSLHLRPACRGAGLRLRADGAGGCPGRGGVGLMTNAAPLHASTRCGSPTPEQD